MRSIRVITVIAAVVGLLAPASAGAATLEPLKPCYVSVGQGQREPVEIRASGFTPDSHVDVAIDGVVAFPGVQVDPAGAVLGRVRAPYQASGQRPFTISVTEQGQAQNSVTATAEVTALRVNVRPRRAPSSSRVRFSGRGFTAERPVFGHYVYAGHVRKTVRFGLPELPCGLFSVQRRQIPIDAPRVGDWMLQIDQQRRYSAQPDGVSVPITIRVERVVH